MESNSHLRIEVAGDFIWTPGQHCFLRFTEFGIRAAITSHPFTICSTQAESALVFYVQPKGGFTGKLYELARNSPAGISTTKVLIDGPYGGIDMTRFDASDRVIIVAGGSGAGWCLPLIARFVEGISDAKHLELGTSGDVSIDPSVKDRRSSRGEGRSLRVILSAKDAETLKWFIKALEALLTSHTGRYDSGKFDVNLHLTRDLEEKFDSPSKDVSVPATKSVRRSYTEAQESDSDALTNHKTVSNSLFPGRPHLPVLLHEEATKASEDQSTMGVFVCGPSSMQNDVRNAVARENLAVVRGARSGPVYLHQEHFSWA